MASGKDQGPLRSESDQQDSEQKEKVQGKKNNSFFKNLKK